MCGIDNQFWDDTSGTTIATPPAAITGGGFANIQAYIQNNPYVILTGTPQRRVDRYRNRGHDRGQRQQRLQQDGR